MGVPQGSCASPILAAYFMALLSEAIASGTWTRLTDHPMTLTNLCSNHSTLSPHTLYVDDGSISTSAHTREESTQIVRSTFESTHDWLKKRGLKMDQVKCELIHFTRSNRGRHTGPGPSISIPTNMEGESRIITPSKTTKYLGMWIDECLTLNKHVKKATMKVLTAAHSLRLLGNSKRGIHQTLWRQLYYSTILPIALYGLPLYWRSYNGQTLNHLKRLQNECLHLITGTFKTTPTLAMEIEASIPPINLYLEYRLDTEALCLSRLDDNPIMTRVPDELHQNLTFSSPPPIPKHLINPRRMKKNKKTPSLCVSQITQQIQAITERTCPLATTPWHHTDLDNVECVHTLLPL